MLIAAKSYLDKNLFQIERKLKKQYPETYVDVPDIKRL